MGRKTVFRIKSILMVACLTGGLFPFFASATTVTFGTAGNQSWQVPSGVTEITVKTWGAGGGGAAAGAGGGGGFAQATLSVTPLETLTVYVGGAGNFGGSQQGGGGGGYSAVTRGATYLVQAGGGGGGAGADNEGAMRKTLPFDRLIAYLVQTIRLIETAWAAGTGAGGPGGGSTGIAGDSGSTGAGGGNAGTTTNGGNGGTGVRDGSDGGIGGPNFGGSSGGTGGIGGSNGGGDGGIGGGGGGRYGGGGGGNDGHFVPSLQVGGGGGGGSSLVTGTNTVETAGSGTTPGNNADPDYTGSVGVGGNTSTSGNDGYVVITYGDTTAPTPNPATFSVAPAPDSTTQVSMTATAATDPSTPVAYLFGFSACGANGGTGGTSSSWQASASYSDSILQPNQCYGYTITSRDAVPNTGTTSSASTTYTHANVPGAPSFGTVSATTMTLTNAENSNPAATPITKFAVQVASTSPNDAAWLNKYVDEFGNASATAVWLSDAELDDLVITGLQTGTLYGVQVKARNENTIETAFGSVGSGTPTAAAVVRRVLLGGKVQFRGNVQLR